MTEGENEPETLGAGDAVAVVQPLKLLNAEGAGDEEGGGVRVPGRDCEEPIDALVD